MMVQVRKTWKEIRGRDKEGHWLRRVVYEDRDGNEYVSLGRYGDDPRAMVGAGYFTTFVMDKVTYYDTSIW